MRILPPRTAPPKTPITRRHQPKPANDYSVYRACVRWDFGFTCPLCLLHESDFADATGKAEGSGLMWIEHRLPQSSHPAQRHSYENCLFSCRYCNGARSTTPMDAEGQDQHLLDPTCTAWADHFVLSGNRLAYRPDDADARYTHVTYDLDDERKVDLRAERAALINECLEMLRDGPQRIEFLLDIAQSPHLSAEERIGLCREAERIRSSMKCARCDLERRAAIPESADRACRCGSTTYHDLPPALANQVLELDWL